MRAGDVIWVDFGIPAGSEPGFIRPAVVVTADVVLAQHPRTLHVVPITSNVARSLPTEVAVTAPSLGVSSAAQCHLCSVIGLERIMDRDIDSIGIVELTQIRTILGDLFDISSRAR